MATMSIRTSVCTPSDPVTAFKSWLTGASKFRNGLVFTITAFDFVQIIKDGETTASDDARQHPVLRTSVGENDHIWLSSYKEDGAKLDFDGNPVLRDGTLDNELYKIIAGDITASTLDKLKSYVNRTVKVRRKLYVGRDPFDPKKTKTLSIPCFDLI